MKSQFQIKAANVDEEGIQVRKIMLDAASKYGLFENTTTSEVPHTILSLVERSGFGFGLGSRISDGLILVDFNPRGGDLAKLDQIKTHLRHALGRLFRARLMEIMEDAPSYVGLNQ